MEPRPCRDFASPARGFQYKRSSCFHILPIIPGNPTQGSPLKLPRLPLMFLSEHPQAFLEGILGGRRPDIQSTSPRRSLRCFLQTFPGRILSKSVLQNTNPGCAATASSVHAPTISILIPSCTAVHRLAPRPLRRRRRAARSAATAGRRRVSGEARLRRRRRPQRRARRRRTVRPPHREKRLGLGMRRGWGPGSERAPIAPDCFLAGSSSTTSGATGSAVPGLDTQPFSLAGSKLSELSDVVRRHRWSRQLLLAFPAGVTGIPRSDPASSPSGVGAQGGVPFPGGPPRTPRTLPLRRPPLERTGRGPRFRHRRGIPWESQLRSMAVACYAPHVYLSALRTSVGWGTGR